jgi:ABC-type sugar transport system substrate-binding protein
MKTRIALAAGLGVLTLLAAGCGDDSDSPDTSDASDSPSTSDASDSEGGGSEAVQVAFVTKFPVAFFTAMSDAAKGYESAHDDEVDISYFECKTPSDVACQIAQIEDAVAQDFQAIVITPMGPEVVPALDAAADSGVKVVLVDNDMEEFTKETAVAATDNVKGGELAGEYLATVLEEGDTIGLMEGVRGVPALDARIEGVKTALEAIGVNVVLGGAETKCDAAQGATVAEDLLTREPDLTAIYAACDDPALAAVTVAQQKGKDILIMGYDGLPDAAKAIQAGDMNATIAQFPGQMAELGVDAAVKAVNGESVETFIDTGTELVTEENADQFLEFN